MQPPPMVMMNGGGGSATKNGLLVAQNSDIDDQQLETIIRRPDQPSITDVYHLDKDYFARGKFATVRRIQHRKTGQIFAAKTMKKRRLRCGDVTDEIMHEIRVLLASDECPRIVRLHEVFETKTDYTLVLELAEGGELQKILDMDDQIEEEQCRRLMRQIVEGVRFLHRRQIAHLDIKPQNILLTEPLPVGDVKLCDFGISRLIRDKCEVREIMGTTDYMPPEILQYEPISLASDMWSIGIVAYAMLSGRTPFGADDKVTTYSNITSSELEFPEEYFENVSDCAKDFIWKLLVRDPKKRMTCDQCLEHEWLATLEPLPAAPVKIQIGGEDCSHNNNTSDIDVEDDDDVESDDDLSSKRDRSSTSSLTFSSLASEDDDNKTLSSNKSQQQQQQPQEEHNRDSGLGGNICDNNTVVVVVVDDDVDEKIPVTVNNNHHQRQSNETENVDVSVNRMEVIDDKENQQHNHHHHHYYHNNTSDVNDTLPLPKMFLHHKRLSSDISPDRKLIAVVSASSKSSLLSKKFTSESSMSMSSSSNTTGEECYYKTISGSEPRINQQTKSFDQKKLLLANNNNKSSPDAGGNNSPPLTPSKKIYLSVDDYDYYSCSTDPLAFIRVRSLSMERLNSDKSPVTVQECHSSSSTKTDEKTIPLATLATQTLATESKFAKRVQTFRRFENLITGTSTTKFDSTTIELTRRG